MSLVTGIAVALWRRLAGAGPAEPGGAEAPPTATPPTPADDPAFAPWAAPSLMQRAGLRLPRSPWDEGGREDPDEVAAHRVGTFIREWHYAPRMAARLRVPKPSVEDVKDLWQSWPDLARGLQLPKPEEWVERAPE